jgi:hypothetical protein
MSNGMRRVDCGSERIKRNQSRLDRILRPEGHQGRLPPEETGVARQGTGNRRPGMKTRQWIVQGEVNSRFPSDLKRALCNVSVMGSHWSISIWMSRWCKCCVALKKCSCGGLFLFLHSGPWLSHLSPAAVPRDPASAPLIPNDGRGCSQSHANNFMHR